MAKLFRDVDYYAVQASNCTQREFELDFADVIEVYDTNETTLTTEEGRTLTITWCELGYFKSYHIVYETSQMESATVGPKVQHIISLLKNLTLGGDSVDGETMQYILERVGMQDQMLRQLMLSQPFDDVEYLWEERKNL